MDKTIELNGMTWDHTRGYDPLVVTSHIFCETHPNSNINWQKRSLQAFADEPLDAMAREFDLIVIDHPHLGEAAKSGMLVAFNDICTQAELNTLAQQSTGVSHESYEFENKQWALAIDAATPVAAYRPDLLQDIPQTWQQVITLSQQGSVLWPLIPINALMSFFNLLANINCPFGEGSIGAETDTAVTILEQMRLVSDNIPKQCFNMDPIDAYEWLSSRSSHSYVPFLYGYSNYSRTGFRPHLVKVANIPCLGDDGPIGSPVGGTGIAISKYCKNIEMAKQYALWIASADCQKGVFYRAGGQPANLVAWKDELCNQDSHGFFKDTLETLEKSYLRPRHNGYMAFQDIAGDIIFDFLTNNKSAKATSQKINDEYQRSLDHE
ncbi:MAG: extracellular solute-binding protein [Rhizobiales bacterium]|nr:extracellular solute-binding protein [Hyphomicrobiales bacterium]